MEQEMVAEMKRKKDEEQLKQSKAAKEKRQYGAGGSLQSEVVYAGLTRKPRVTRR